MTDVTDYLARLAKLDACIVSDTMDSLGLAPSVPDLLRLSGEGTLVGQVMPVLLAEGKPDPSAPKVHLGATAIVQGTRDETVIVVSHPGIDAGGWGGMLSNAAQLAGIRGVVVDGPCRDVDEARAMGFPVFARRGTARTARGRVYEVSTGAPVVIGDVTVNKGDFVIADASGTVFIPFDRAEEILAKCEQLSAKEALMLADLRAGHPITKVMGANYETMLEKA